ncbi:MAG: response regulator transcription factor [Pseudomonadota bacterium]
MSVSDTYTAVLADDHDIVRDGLRAALERSDLLELLTLNIVAETSNGFETLAAVKEHQPDLLLLDLTMPLSGGAEVYTDVRRWSPHTKIVVYSSVTAPGVLSMLVSAGVDGMFAKGGSNKLLYQKLPLILRGGRFIAPECMAMIEGHEDVVSLTAREHQTLHLVLSGKTTKEIAATQGISPRTVEKHRASLMQKLEVSSVAELMAKALKDGLLDSSSTI